ncbi:MAG: M56 family metallopeptidase [Clostridia bacterium]|nr:M56 family metallopeptidase [Clostridia bacterium]
MTDILRTLLFLNIQGSVLVVLLLLLKRVIQKSFSGRAQRNLWLFAAIVFLLPVWNLIPENTAPSIILPYYSENIFTYETPDNTAAVWEMPDEKLVTDVDASVKNIDYRSIVLSVWGAGAGLFLILNISGYVIFLTKKRRRSENITDNEFSGILQSLDIKSKIRLRQCDDVDSPMLTGVFYPVVYIPKKSLAENELTHIYNHELTHYKHKDLPIKWFVCVINAINWFNPCMYFVMKNLNEACEIYCDETVTKNMDDDRKKQYMNTILNLVAKK